MKIAFSFEAQPPLAIGADGETRTPTPVKALAPEASVSTNSTTSAPKEERIIKTTFSFVKCPPLLFFVFIHQRDN